MGALPAILNNNSTVLLSQTLAPLLSSAFSPSTMPIERLLPNHLLSDESCQKYSEYFDSLPISPVPVQFPAHLSVDPDREIYIYNSHRGPEFVPCGSPASCSIPSHRLRPNPFYITAGSRSPESPGSSSDTGHVSPDSLSSLPPLLSLTPSPTSSLSSLSDRSSLFNSIRSSPSHESPIPSSPLSRALIPTFDPNNGWAAMDSVLLDPTLRSFTRLLLGSPLQYHVPSTDDVLLHLDMGQQFAVIRRNVCTMICDTFSRMADFLLCAANDHNPWFLGGRPDISSSIECSKLEELGLQLPGLVLFRSYSLEKLSQRHFPTIDSAIAYLDVAKSVYNYYLHWIANAIRLSVQYGYWTSWRWGAPLCMSHTEFTHRITRHFMYDGYKSLERLMAHQLLRNEMGFGTRCPLDLGTFSHTLT